MQLKVSCQISFSNPTTDAHKDLEVVLTQESGLPGVPVAHIVQYEAGLWDRTNCALPGLPMLFLSVAKLQGKAHTHRELQGAHARKQKKTAVSPSTQEGFCRLLSGIDEPMDYQGLRGRPHSLLRVGQQPQTGEGASSIAHSTASE